MKTVTIANPKGGVAKSTTTLHVAYKAAEQGLKVLVVDYDMQASITDSLLGNQAERHEQTSAILFTDVMPEPILSNRENIWLLAASSLQGEILNNLQCETMADLAPVKESFKKLETMGFDLVLIDTAGILGFKPPMTTAALLVSDFVLIPTTIGSYEAKSLAKSWKYINSIRSSGHNRRLQMLGILPCRINSTSSLELEGLKQLQEGMGQAILPYSLAERAAVKQAISAQIPVWERVRGAGHRKAAQEWIQATEYIIEKVMA